MVCEKEAFLLINLLQDIKRLYKENGIEKSIITNIRTLKMKIKDYFLDETSFDCKFRLKFDCTIK